MPGKLILSRRSALALGVGGIAIASRPAWAVQGAAASAVDGIVAAFMSTFEMPAIAFAMLADA